MIKNMLKSLKFIFYCLILISNNVHASKQLDILSIHSYHQEYPWTYSQYEAFKKQIKSNFPGFDINFSSEYLNTKKISPSDQYRQNFLDFIQSKYKNHRPDLIYVTDDNALNFIHSEHSNHFWKPMPVVFSGINDTKINEGKMTHPIAGIFEYKDIYSAITLAKSITKKSSKIIFIGDGGTTDKAIKAIIEKNNFSNDDFDISHMSFSKLNSLINEINTHKDNTIILTTIGRVRDEKNNILSLEQTIKAITNTGKKILIMEDAYLYPGILGGYMTSGRVQGESAANIASNIIKGEKINSLKRNHTEFVLSWPEIKRFKINLEALHLTNAKIINKPLPFTSRYPEIIKWLSLFVLTLILIIVGFIYNARQKNIQLKEQYIDPLTKLSNRARLLRDINKLTVPYLIIIDINNFKSINEIYGLKEADKLLINFGKKICEHTNETHKTYRIAGDQFAILSEHNNFKDNNNEFIKNILKELQDNSYHIGDFDIGLTLTAGISGDERAFLIPRAEQALHKAKEERKSYYVLENNPENTNQHHQNLLWAQKLKVALEEDRIVPFYQPITNNKTGKKNKYEALVRLVDESGEIISPFFFLNAAKSTRQYAALTRVMIEKTFETIYKNNINISINLTVEDIRNKKTIQFFKDKLSELGIAKKVIVELTESEGIENYAEVAEFIAEIKGLGCKVAIDDFGTGYSNFTHLIHLNVDYLKIDGSIIQNILTDKNAEIVAKTLVDFAKQLGIQTIAEFVDSQEILDKVKEIGVDFSQGYFLGKPQATLSD